jgi:putative peptidoglycan lipid II flippase
LIRAMLGNVIAILALLTSVLACGAHWFLPLIAGGFGRGQVVETERLFFILLWIVPLSGVSTYWSAILNASGVFLAAALAPIATPLSMLIGLLMFVPRCGIDALAWSTVAGYGVELGLLLLAMRARKLPVLPIARWHEQAGNIARQYGCLFAGALLMSSSTIIDQSMATWLSPGSVSELNYGNKLAAVLLGTMSVGVSTVVFPHFSQLVAQDDGRGIRRTLYALSRVILLASIPLTIMLILFSQPIARLLFGRGAVTSETIAAISTVQSCYLLQVPVFMLGVVGARLLTALGRTRVLLQISAINMVLNVAGNLLFVRMLGVAGIAFSTSCVYLLSTTMIFIALRGRIGNLAPLSSFAGRMARAA